MATTQDEIRTWLKYGESQGCTHVIVVVDRFDHEDYPVFVTAEENVRDKEREYDAKSMQSVMEVYSLTGKHSIESQLNASRAFYYD